MLVGIVGRGVGLRLHAPVLEAMPNVESRIVRLPHVDPDQLRPEHPVDSALVGLDDLDVLVVTSPPFAHVAHTLSALRSGIPVLCEKPCGIDGAGARSLARAAHECGLPVVVNYQLRFDPLLRRWRESVGGDFDELIILYESASRRHLASAPTWYTLAAQGGGVVNAVLSHLIDLLGWLGEKISRVVLERSVTGTACARPDLTNDDTAGLIVSCELTSGRRARLQVTGLATRDRFVIAADRLPSRWVDVIGGRELTLARLADTPTYASGALRSTAPRPWRSAQQSMYQALLGRTINTDGCVSPSEAAATHDTLSQVVTALRAPDG